MIAEITQQLGGQQSVLFGAAALLTALGGIAAALTGSKSNEREVKSNADDDCRRRTQILRDEAEELADQLHKLRMNKLQGEET